MLSNTSKISICNRLEYQRSKQEEKNPEVANSSSVMAKARLASQKKSCLLHKSNLFIYNEEEGTTTGTNNNKTNKHANS